MKIFFVIQALFVMVQPVAAACNYDLVEMVDWKIAPIDDDTNLLTTTFRFRGDKTIRMIDGSVGFRDVLGENVASFSLDRDMRLEPEAEFSQSGRWGQYTFERLLDLRNEDVEGWVCVRAVVYEDGGIDRF